MKQRKGGVGDKTTPTLATATKTGNRKIRIVSTVFIYYLTSVIAQELSTIGSAATGAVITFVMTILK
jgi:hypothetical protein